MTTQRKYIEATNLKTGPEGVMEMYVAVFGNIDAVGDVVKPGAFDECLAYMAKQGKSLPIVYAHNWSDAWDVIGYADVAGGDVYPDAKGLFVRAHLFMDNPKAKHVYSLARSMKLGASFAYDTMRSVKNRSGGEDLIKLDLIEAGPCLVGMNSEAGVVGVKDVVGRKVGRRNSAADQALIQEAHDAVCRAGAVCNYKDADDTDIDDEEIDAKIAAAEARALQTLARHELKAIVADVLE